MLAVACGSLGPALARGDDPSPAPAPAPDPAPGPALPPPAPPKDPAAAKAAHEAAHKAFVASVNAAIDKGRKYLLDAQRPEGTWTPRKPATDEVDGYGAQALVLTALGKTGVPPTHPKVALGLKVLEKMIVERRGQQKWVGIEPGHRTYAAACVAMCYDAFYVEHPKVRRAGVRADGSPAAGKPKDNLPKGARDELEDIVTFFVKTQRGKTWRYPGPKDQPEDLSATQYALMGLLTAERVGVRAPPELYRRALERILEWQETKGDPGVDLVPLYVENPAWDPTDRYPRLISTGRVQARGFGYRGKETITGSMTCAGISCLAILKDRLKDPRLRPPIALSKAEEKTIDKAINSGIGWLAKSFTVTENPGVGAGWHYYYLYGMERAASLIGLEWIGTHDWYREAASYLVEQQAPDGSWPKEKDVHVQTSFALLVLERATVPTGYGPPPVTGGGDEAPKDGAGVLPPPGEPEGKGAPPPAAGDPAPGK